jgi:hypothetical protein
MVKNERNFAGKITWWARFFFRTWVMPDGEIIPKKMNRMKIFRSKMKRPQIHYSKHISLN